MSSPCAAIPLVDFFDDIEEPRVERARLHALHDILAPTIPAVICGADSWTDVELFGSSKHDWLSTFLDLPHDIPSHDTYGRVFALLDPEALAGSFSCWVQSLASQLPGEVVAIDGRTARRSHDRWLGVPALHVVRPGRWRHNWSWVSGRPMPSPTRLPPSPGCWNCWN